MDAGNSNFHRAGGGTGGSGGAASVLVERNSEEGWAVDGQKPGAIREPPDVSSAVELPHVQHHSVGLAADEQDSFHTDGGGGPHGGGVQHDGDDAVVHPARHVALGAVLAGQPQPRDAHTPLRVRGHQHHGDEVQAAPRAHADPLHHVLRGDVDPAPEWPLAAAPHRARPQVERDHDRDLVLLPGVVPRDPDLDVPLHDPRYHSALRGAHHADALAFCVPWSGGRLLRSKSVLGFAPCWCSIWEGGGRQAKGGADADD